MTRNIKEIIETTPTVQQWKSSPLSVCKYVSCM